MVGLYIVGQGAADWGKEREKLVQAATAVASSAEKLPEPSKDAEAPEATEALPEASTPKVLTEEA